MTFVGRTEARLILTSASDECFGTIDEVAVWNAELTDNDISILANSKVKHMPLQISPGNIIFYLPMDDQPDGTSADGDTLVNQDNPGTANGTGNDGANNTGLTWKAEAVLSYP